SGGVRSASPKPAWRSGSVGGTAGRSRGQTTAGGPAVAAAGSRIRAGRGTAAPFGGGRPRPGPARGGVGGGAGGPDGLVARQAEDAGNGVAVLRARRPPAQQDRHDALLVQAAARGQLPGVEAALSTQLFDGPGRVAHGSAPSRTAAELRAVAVDVLDLV